MSLTNLNPKIQKRREYMRLSNAISRAKKNGQRALVAKLKEQRDNL